MEETKFHEVMALPFVDKANRIEKNLAFIRNESWLSQSNSDLKKIFEKIDYIDKQCRPRIEENIDYQFKNPNLLLFVLLYVDLSKLFNEIRLMLLPKSIHESLTSEDIREMMELKEDMMTLAFIGDRALELGIMHSIWPEGDTITIPLKGTLDDKKKAFVNNYHQTQLLNFLNLFDSQILIKNPIESYGLSGSRMEAIFGIVYLESGLEAVEHAVKTISSKYETIHSKKS
jgi:23S rRNA maturation mini-RNase III